MVGPVTQKPNTFRRVVKKLASLKFAVVIIIAIGTLVAWGTIVEAMYMDAKIAAEKVYHSPLSYTIFALFAVNLIAVIVDRFPWKRHHIGFITAHIGILILLGGSVLTRYYGVDGSISLDIGGKESYITVAETDLIIYTALMDGKFKKYYEQNVNFLRSPPSSEKPLRVEMPSGDLEVVDFYPYALVDQKTTASESKEDPPAVRFQIANDRVTQSEWMIGKKNEPVELPLGPARIVLTTQDYKYVGGNVLVLKPIDEKFVAYQVYSGKQKKMINSGKAEAGAKFNLGWMNLEFRLLKYLPQAKQNLSFLKREQSSPEAISAIKFRYNGKENWLGLNSMVRLFGESEIYIVTYGNRRLPLNFDMYLKDFKVGRYQGTMRAASYESLVSIPKAQREVLISMNEPLKYNGYTFYQASFQEDPTGQPVASILSVNYDPGRWVKYLGSLLIVLGAIHLFYRRWKRARSANA